MKLPQGPSLRLGFWTVLCLSIFAWAPATYPGYWQALEGFVPVFNVAESGRLATVAMSPDVWRGSGAATFLLARPWLFFGADAVTAVRITFIFCFLLGGLGIYVWLRDRLGDRAAGLAGLTYLFAPPFLATVYVRGSLSDALILGLLPIALAGVAAYAQSASVSAAGITVIALGWMWQTQAGLAVFCSILLLLYALLVERSWMATLVVGLGTAAAWATILPLLTMQASTPVRFEEHFVALFQLFRTQWAVAPSLPGWQDAYPFQLGLVALLGSVIALWLWCMQRPTHVPPITNRLLWFGWVGLLLCGFGALAGSALLWQWSGASRLLTYPWQLLLLTGPCLAITAGTLPVANRQFQQTPYWVVLVLLTVFASYPSLTTEFTTYVPPTRPMAVVGNNEVVVLAATLTENRQQQRATLAVTWQPIGVMAMDYNIFFQALAGDASQNDAQALTVAAQLDSQPLGTERPATSWRPGEILTNTYQLDLAGVDPAVSLHYYFGYYDWQTGMRLPVDGGIDDKMVFHGE